MKCELTRLGLGAGTLGNLYRVVSDEDALATVSSSWENGIRYFDTAPFYGSGLSERRVGDALREYPREEFVLSTKVGRLLRPIPHAKPQHGFVSPMPFEPVYDYSYDGVLSSFESSLHRLGLSRIDIVYMHDIGQLTHGADHDDVLESSIGGFKALNDLKEQGVINAIGIGVNEVEVCNRVLDCHDIDVILLAGRYTLLEQIDALTLFDRCKANGVAVVAAGIFSSGILGSGTRTNGTIYYDYEPATADVIARVERLESVCSQFEISLPAAAMQFAIMHPVVSSILVGMSGAKRVSKNAELINTPIPVEFWSELKDRGLIEFEAI